MELSVFEGFRVIEFASDKNKGLFATREFAEGEELYPFDYWSQEIMPMHMTNHSCDPNASFNDKAMLIATRDIAVNEEITYDYLPHPVPASPWNFECLCGAGNCRGWISVSS